MTLAEFFASGRIADAMLALLLLEGVGLVWLYRRTGRGIPPRDLICGLLAGAGLVLAMRAALVGAHWLWVWAGMTLSLVAHIGDGILRWRKG